MPTPNPSVSESDVRSSLRGVIDPELGDNVVDLGMIRQISNDGDGTVTVWVALTVATCPLRSQLQRDIVARTESLPGVTKVNVEMTTMSPEERSAVMARARWKARDTSPDTEIPPNTRVLAIASGKGGVGKSSIAVNLAVALANRGLTVGLLDADIAGFSVPHLLGLRSRLQVEGGKMRPLEAAYGKGTLKVVSMGLIEGSGEDQAVMFRGLMLNRALQHFLEDVRWGPLDYLLIDMPPGTGDVQMGLARMLPRADMIVITTPAMAAQQVAARAIDMARRGFLRVAGVIENMSAMDVEGNSLALFGSGGGARLAESSGVPLLAQVPLDPAISSGGDTGSPVASETPTLPAGRVFARLAADIVENVAPLVQMDGCTSRLLDALNRGQNGPLPQTARVDE